MYYGNSTASIQENPAGVWSNGYAGVWHLDNGFADSTSNNNNGYNTLTTDAAGIIGRARYFDYATNPYISSYITIPNSPSLSITSNLTMEAWVKLTGTGIQQGPPYTNISKIVGKSDGSSSGYIMGVQDNGVPNLGLYAEIWNTTGGYNHFDNSGSFPLYTWTYLAVTWQNPGNMIGYINKVAVKSIPTLSKNIGTNTRNTRIGTSPWDNNQWNTTGWIDEVRLSSVARSQDWIFTEYNNQASPSTFATPDVEVSSPCGWTPSTSSTPMPWVNDCSWRKRKMITIDHTKVSGTLSNFPVLINLGGDSDLMNSAQSDGDDIFFTAADGTTKLSHEIESYSNGALIAWVNVTTLSSVSDTVLYMYYGDPYSPSQANPTGVWDSNYMAVWHLDEPVTDESTSGVHYDSTSNGNNGAQHNNGPGTGEIDGAQSFDGTDYILGPDASSLDMTSQLTMEAWVNLANAANNQKIVGKTSSNPSGVTGAGYILGVQSNGLYPEIWDKSSHYTFTSGTVPNNAWTHLAVTWATGGNFIGYVNGTQVNSIAASSNPINETATQEERIGVAPYLIPPQQYYVTGLLDEIRLSKIARSPQWIQTEYTNQNSPSTFYSLAGEEAAPCAPPPIPPSYPPTPQTPNPPWLSCGWTYRKNITIDKAKVVGTQNNFPVLINTTDPDLKAHARSNGYDIVFTDTSNPPNQMPYEREKYDSTTGALTAWVKANISSSANTTIYMYYGYPSSPDMSATASVWDNGYAGVWHLDNDFSDSTSAQNTGTSYNTPTQITGKIAGAWNFLNQSKEYADISKSYPSGSGLNITGIAITYEAWINATLWVNMPNKTTWGYVVGKDDWAGGFRNGSVLRTGNSTQLGNLSFCVGNGTSWIDAFTGPVMNTNRWYFVAGTYNGTFAQAYINGTMSTGTSGRSSNLPITNSLYNLNFADDAYSRILGSGTMAGMYFNGSIDEVRISNVVRDPTWLATEFNNQNSPSTFAYIGPEQAYFCGVSGPAYVQSTSQSFVSKQQARITLPGSSISGDLLVLSFTYDQSLGISPSVTDSKGNTYNIARSEYVDNWGTAQTWYAKNIVGGPGPVTATVTLSGAASSVFDVFFLEYSGVSTSAPIQSTSYNGTSATNMNTSSLTITSAPSLLYGFGADVSPGHSCQLNANYTNRQNFDGQCAGDQTVLFTGPFNVTATQTPSGYWALHMLAFNGA